VKASEGLATAVAKEALVEQVGAALDALPGVNGDQAIDLARKTNEYFVVKILHAGRDFLRAEPGFAWEKIRGGKYGAAGSGAVPTAIYYHKEIVAFVVENAEKLKVFVEAAFHDPALVQMIDEIVRAFGVTSPMGI
jgi:hypothetical protein